MELGGEALEHARVYLQIAAYVITIIGLPLAAITIWLETRRAGKARDVETVLHLAESLRLRWEAGWRDRLGVIEARQGRGEELSEDLATTLEYMLNWVHWLGVMMRKGLVAEPDTLMLSIGPVMTRIISAGRATIDAEEREHGRGYWAGVREIERRVAKR